MSPSSDPAIAAIEAHIESAGVDTSDSSWRTKIPAPPRGLSFDADRTYTESYDKLILAPGADPLVPPIPGKDATGVFTLRNLEDTDKIAEAMPDARHVVVVGGGYVGLETVEQFRRKGLDVALVEMQDRIQPGDKVILCSVGAGITTGVVTLEW